MPDHADIGACCAAPFKIRGGGVIMEVAKKEVAKREVAKREVAQREVDGVIA
ncbi:hypothetical protein Cme02nite_52990 [Catellatospora methionotrophica]|uniref:Uncharacterized protein n=1 Tax=Catellatospora methionotrophica TaxID=121620 RepID=A0A8J3PH47_9ACTN|nr:hypothetical protein Cme02nite_52990 [Catellatospora methionotrophica]